MARKRASAPARPRYGVEAELDRLLSCPECGSNRARPNVSQAGGYGFFGFKAIGDLTVPRDVACRNCGHEWVRPPLRELRAEAERRIGERYDRFAEENRRLLDELERDKRTNFAPIEDDNGSTDVTPSAPGGRGPAN